MPKHKTTNRHLIAACVVSLTACTAVPDQSTHSHSERSNTETYQHQSPRGEVSPVIQAIISGNLKQLQLILNQGANANATDAVDGREPALSALSSAIVWGRPDMVKVLIEAGASVNYPIPSNGATPLHWAAGISRVEINDGLITQKEQVNLIDLLIVNGANVNAKDSYGTTPLFWAANAGATEVVELLLSSGANPGIKSVVGTTAAIAALESGHSDISVMLRDKNSAQDTKIEDSSTSLAEAILSGDLPTVKAILESNPILAVSRSKRGNTPIILALLGKQVDVALYFAKTYPDALSVSGQSKWTPLHFVFNSHQDSMLDGPSRRSLAMAMINHGAPLEAQTEDGMTPLFLAIYNAMPEGVEVLLKAGSDPNYRIPATRVSPLMVAATRDPHSIELLLANGATPALKDWQGRTALHYLAQNQELTSSESTRAFIEMLIDNGASVDSQDYQLETPLMIAARAGNALFAEQLMEHEADPTLQNSRGETAEFIALVSDHFEVIQKIRQAR